MKSDCKQCEICNMNLNLVIQSCKVKLGSNTFEATDNNFDNLNSVHWDQYPITMVTWCCWELWHRLFVFQWYVSRPQHPAARSNGWAKASLLHGGHVRLGVNFMSWSNFCVLVWLSLPWRDFITLSDIIRICSHFMVVTWILVWFFSSVLNEIYVLVGFCLSWWHFIPWCNHPNLGMISFVLDTILFIVRLYFFWCRFISWCDHLHLGIIFLHFTRLFRLRVVLFDLV